MKNADLRGDRATEIMTQINSRGLLSSYPVPQSEKKKKKGGKRRKESPRQAGLSSRRPNEYSPHFIQPIILTPSHSTKGKKEGKRGLGSGGFVAGVRKASYVNLSGSCSYKERKKQSSRRAGPFDSAAVWRKEERWRGADELSGNIVHCSSLPWVLPPHLMTSISTGMCLSQDDQKGKKGRRGGEKKKKKREEGGWQRSTSFCL